eukprot:gnl/MRDRNA2_/MRDRNA2_55265_c0_seq1.p1 gnl/MRDRNA2_/MRDRNA2_55265_c0~~gnl/MRDRNA2_/MRDRNA2_55265_c0_seq1.p1  ORF type:complete len:438 (+),score=66.48 gnl/MRDRNA2_/MRDRNA2_55265_c0_seq1:73-1386(+)
MFLWQQCCSSQTVVTRKSTRSALQMHVSVIEASRVNHAGGCALSCGSCKERVPPGMLTGDRLALPMAHARCFDIRWIPPCQVTFVVRPEDSKIHLRLLPVSGEENVIKDDELHQRRKRFIATKLWSLDEDGELELAEDDDRQEEEQGIVDAELLHEFQCKARLNVQRPGCGTTEVMLRMQVPLSGPSGGHILLGFSIDAGLAHRCGAAAQRSLNRSTLNATTLPTGRLHVFLAENGLGNFNDSSPAEGNVLHMALWRGDDPLCREILARKDFFGVNGLDWCGQTVLHVAARQGKALMCEAILARDDFFSCDTSDFFGQTALHLAARYNYVDAGLMILRDGSLTACTKVDMNGMTPLHHAAMHGNETFCRELMKLPGCVPHATDCFGNSAAHLAALNCHFEVHDLLSARKTKSSHTLPVTRTLTNNTPLLPMGKLDCS